MTAATPDDVEYHRPEALDAVHDLLDRHGQDAKIVAGGQSLLLLLRQDMIDPGIIVDITDVDELHGVTETDDTVRIGATTTYTDLESGSITDRYEVINDAVGVIADQQVRNAGTIGGAVSHADPYLDIIPPLLCLDAQVNISGSEGTRTLPLEEFCWGYLETDLQSSEIVESITFERDPVNSGAYVKVSNVHGGWATVGVAATVTLSDNDGTIEDVHVALAGVGDTAVRASTVEAELAGQPPSDAAVESAGDAVTEDIDPLGDLTGSAEYKSKVARNLTERCVNSAIERTGGAR